LSFSLGGYGAERFEKVASCKQLSAHQGTLHYDDTRGRGLHSVDTLAVCQIRDENTSSRNRGPWYSFGYLLVVVVLILVLILLLRRLL
jgi:hypothetical protein